MSVEADDPRYLAALERKRLRLAAIEADRKVERLEEEARRARQALTKLDNEAGVYREAFARGGSLGPPEFYETMGKALTSVRAAELAVVNARREAKR